MVIFDLQKKTLCVREKVLDTLAFFDTSFLQPSPAILVAMTFVLLFAGLCQVAMAVLICHTKYLMVLTVIISV